MGKLYHLNKIKLSTEEDALEFIDMVAAKLPEVKRLIKKGQMERQSLRNRVAMPAPQNLRVQDDGLSVSERLSGGKPAITASTDSEETNRLAQLKAASAPKVQPKPGDIGSLNLRDDGLEDDDEGKDKVTPPSQADLTPVANRVAGKAQSIKNAKKRSSGQSLRKK